MSTKDARIQGKRSLSYKVPRACSWVSTILDFLKDSKVFSTNVVDCDQSGENIKAVVIVFDNGYTEVRCPVKKSNCRCSYGKREQPTSDKKIGFKQTLTRIIIIALVIYALTFAGIQLFRS